ncbi:hypothetical protein [Phaeobacter inhibens]|uniref:hypothetical protein n=1 Tax=Phaeobacter inhibens TaxID=221822 RepID=UPI0012EC41FA|nr:hypothetical protein [Phaeobacter inhibens]
MKKTILKTAFKAPLAYDRQNGFRTPRVSEVFEFLGIFTSRCEMVRTKRVPPNSTLNESQPDFNDIFQELERWNDILKDDKNILRGPKP